MLKLKNNKGISALPTVLIVSMVIIEVSVISVILANIFNNSRFGERLAAEAYSAARSGAQDLMLGVIREKDCPNFEEVLQVGNRTVTRSCTSDSGTVEIISTGNAFLRSKKIRVIMGVNSETNEVSLRSIEELGI